MGVLAGLFSGSMQTEVDGGGGFQHLLSLRCPLWGGGGEGSPQQPQGVVCRWGPRGPSARHYQRFTISPGAPTSGLLVLEFDLLPGLGLPSPPRSPCSPWPALGPLVSLGWGRLGAGETDYGLSL